MNDAEWQICVNVGNAPFFYKGKILRDTPNVIFFEDRKLGEIEIYKSAIVSKQKLNGGGC